MKKSAQSQRPLCPDPPTIDPMLDGIPIPGETGRLWGRLRFPTQGFGFHLSSHKGPLLDPTMLFRFEVRLQQHAMQWTARGLSLPESCRVPSFAALSGGPIFADVRIAWDVDGIGFQLLVNGKRQLPWCRDTRLDESDGLHLWMDTRNSPNIHRATQHCHRFLWLPAGGGPKRERPVAALVPINRARTNPKPIRPDILKIHALPRHDGYELSGFIPAEAMTGFDPKDQSQIGFYYLVADRELGNQALTLSTDFPVAEDPSLWAEAALISK